MSAFDVDSFLDQTTDQALTRRPPLPAGATFHAITGAPKARAWTSQKPDAKVKSGIAIDLPVIITLPEDLAKEYGVPSVTITQGIMIDSNEAGMIDWSPGKNGNLRRWREALNLNTPGQTFSIRSMEARPVLVTIKHREYEGELYDEIGAFARVS